MKRIKRLLIIAILLLTIANIKLVYAEGINAEDYMDDEEIFEEEEQTPYHYFKILFISLIGGGVIILILGNLNNDPNKKTSPKEEKIDLSKLGTDIDELELKNDIFKLYKDVQSARTKNKVKTLEPLVTEELYKTLEKEIDNLKKNKEKMVITDILSKELKILSIEEKEEHKYLNVYLHVNQYDYTIDKDKKVKKGTNDSKYHVEYKLKIEYLNNELKLDKIECTGKWISR